MMVPVLSVVPFEYVVFATRPNVSYVSWANTTGVANGAPIVIDPTWFTPPPVVTNVYDIV